MAFDLRKEVEELRKRGASLGLNHDDIDYAILKSLGGNVTSLFKLSKYLNLIEMMFGINFKNYKSACQSKFIDFLAKKNYIFKIVSAFFLN